LVCTVVEYTPSLTLENTRLLKHAEAHVGKHLASIKGFSP